jgi:glycosyltransferase involved in cell wall biosynthesis
MSPPPRLKVLHVVDSLGMGGAETWLLSLLRRWSERRNVEVDVLLTSGRRQLFDDEVVALGARLHYVPFGRAHFAGFALGFRRLLARGAYDALHDHADYASGWHMLLGAGMLPPVRVTHVHNPWLQIQANYALSPLRVATTRMGKQLVERFATHVCGTSQHALDRYGFSSDIRPRVSVVHCGIEIDRFNAPRELDRASVLGELGWPSDSKVVLFAGRLDRALAFDHPQNHKNSWLAANIVRAAADRDSRVRLIMAGAGDAPRKQLTAQIERWGLAERLRLVGVRKDMPRLMRASDLLLFPSREEGLGMVAVEAQAAGLPVLASTAVPAECVVAPELYHARPLTDPLETWAEALLDILASPRIPLARCREALASSPFSIEHSAGRLEAIYRSGRADR